MSPGTRAKPTGLDERKEDVAPTGSSQGNCQQGDEAHRRGKKTNSEQLHIIYRLPPSKVGLKLSIQKTKITASGPITSWQIDGGTMETVTDCILGGFKITADGDCSYEIERCVFIILIFNFLNLLYFPYMYSFVSLSYCSFPLAVNL